MRLKITQALSGRIDGIQLSRFVVGQVYDVGTSFGSFLLSVGAAEPEHEAGDQDTVLRSAPRSPERTTHG